MKMKSILRYFKFLVTDRFYILRERDLYHMGLIVRKIMMKPDFSFGGVCVLLVGNPSQIPPVLGCSLWDAKKLLDAYSQGKSLWGLIYLVLILSLKYPLNCNDPGAVGSYSFLNWFHGGVNKDSDWVIFL